MSGDHRYDDRWDDLSLEAIERDHQHNLAVLKALDAIPRAKLSADDALNYDLFRRDYAEWVERHAFHEYVFPLNHMGGLPEGIRQPPGVQSAGQLGAQLTFATVKDYEAWLARLHRFPAYVAQVTALMRQGIAEKRVHPKIVVSRIPAQLDKQLVADPVQSAFYSPFRAFPAAISPEEQKRLSAAGAEAIRTEVLPALRQLRAFVAGEYLSAAPEQVGVWQLPDGERYYAFAARRATTTSMTPEEIHALGLERGRAAPRRDGAGEGGRRVQGHARRVLHPPAHREAVLLPERRGAAAPLARSREADRPGADEAVPHAAPRALRGRADAGGDGAGRDDRLLLPGLGGRTRGPARTW